MNTNSDILEMSETQLQSHASPESAESSANQVSPARAKAMMDLQAVTPFGPEDETTIDFHNIDMNG